MPEKHTDHIPQAFLFQTEFGACRITVRDRVVISVELAFLSRDSDMKRFSGESPQMDGFPAEVKERICKYFKGEQVEFDDFEVEMPFGSSFSHKILKTCREIAYGQVVSYAQLAQQAGFEGTARAVGNILARNPLPVIIPCHRVIKSDGKTGGFMGSLESAPRIKQRMLDMEKRNKS